MRERSFIRDLQIVGTATVEGWFGVMNLKQEGEGKVHAVKHLSHKMFSASGEELMSP